MSLAKAIRAVGTAKHLAEKLGLSENAISQWKNKYKGIIPPDRVLEVYAVTGVTPHELRPDIYPNSTDALVNKNCTPAPHKDSD
ncbi:transcriptional regulator [Lelliottia wanjuensis]|uniref:transcriptional regulator n=1 Tax=Lelliottia wanjuensis TaxID=3050585 RepID=UPI002550B0DD|nr:YdaS family helix-turn-helix protein [Lelliottia sp. V104_15]MDK9607079.1 YdaS family helix-turn-helix protein [Lelliottia sp. V104_15]